MLHGTEGTLQAYLDGELAPDERVALARHLNACSACSARLDALRALSERFAMALEDIDAEGIDARAPMMTAYANVVRESGTTPSTDGRHPGVAASAAPRVARRAFLRAAVLVVFCATAAAAALPESPIRRWAVGAWSEVAERFGDATADGGREAGTAAAPAAVQPDPVGASILPAGDRVRIILERPAPEARVRVRLVDGPWAAVYAAGMDAPEFRTGTDRIVLTDAGPGEIRIELPRALAYAAVEVDGRVYVVKDADVLRLLAPGPDAVGAEVLFSLP